MDKKQLREHVRKIRDSIPEKNRLTYSEIILDKVVNTREYQTASVIMCFASFGSEVNTFPLIERIIKDEKTLVLPKVVNIGQHKHLDLYVVKNLNNQLLPGVYGIMEPNPDSCEKTEASKVQLFICPGLAFDLKCNRLGYGAGFYDRLFAGLDKGCMKLGIAFDAQIAENVVTDKYDVPMDRIITEKREINRNLTKEVMHIE